MSEEEKDCVKKRRTIRWWLHAALGSAAICGILSLVIFPVLWLGWYAMETLDVSSSNWRGARLRSSDEKSYISIVSNIYERSNSVDHYAAALEECYRHLLAHRERYDVTALSAEEQAAFLKSVEVAFSGYQQNGQRGKGEEEYAELRTYFENKASAVTAP